MKPIICDQCGEAVAVVHLTADLLGNYCRACADSLHPEEEPYVYEEPIVYYQGRGKPY